MDLSSVRPGDWLNAFAFWTGGFISATGGYFLMRNGIALLNQKVDIQDKKIDHQGEKIDELGELLSMKIANDLRFKSQEDRLQGIADGMREIRHETAEAIRELRADIKDLRHGHGFVTGKTATG